MSLFSNNDFCMICNAYDTIQAYAKDGNCVIHVCEECAHGKTDKEIVDAYKSAFAVASKTARRRTRGVKHG